MDTGALQKFAQLARRQLREQVAAQLERVLQSDSAELRGKESVIRELKGEIAASSKDIIVDKVAYIWFNRFCALRFMDVNNYTRIGTVSAAEGHTQPEMLAEAKQGHIDDSLKDFVDTSKVFDLLGGRIASRDPQQEAYRLLLVAVCNYYNAIMPFLFEKIADYTELLMPDDLLSESSILAGIRDTLTNHSCAKVEVIGWLYQFYIAEKKAEVFKGLKKNIKVTPENIPAATQLFTRNWVVRFLVENSLGRLWMLNKPNSKLVNQMNYYIKPLDTDKDFIRIESVKDLRVCDPACGSGHMLVYAFDLLYSIYEEEGFEPTEIPQLILKNNLFGIELDERAAELSAFALAMKAREKYSRFFSKPVQPKICVLKNIEFGENELPTYFKAVNEKPSDELTSALHQFRESNNFGSLIKVNDKDAGDLAQRLNTKDVTSNVFVFKTHEKVQEVLKFMDFLGSKYHVVIANPPYMGVKSLNPRLQEFAKRNYVDSKSDLFAMFIERGFELVLNGGYNAMVTMQSWMFLPSYDQLRAKLLQQSTVQCMVHMDDMVMGIAFGTAACVWKKSYMPDFRGQFSWVAYEDLGDDDIPRSFPVKNDRLSVASATDFKKIPESPVAYWASETIRSIFENATPLAGVSDIKQGLATCNNGKFLRFWFEVEYSDIGFDLRTPEEACDSGKRWFPYNKGGGYRKWYGNNEYVVNWKNNGEDIHRYSNLPIDYAGAPVRAKRFYFREGITYGLISSFSFSPRRVFGGFIFDVGGSMIFPEVPVDKLLGFLASKLTTAFLAILNPTLNYQVGDIQRLPIVEDAFASIEHNWSDVIALSKEDWDQSETSWDFVRMPLLEFNSGSIKGAYSKLRERWRMMTSEMKQFEEENNQLFITAYGLESELEPSVPLKEICLNCNPRFRYGADKSEEEFDKLLVADTMRDLISYAVGCMFGRYSTEKPGLLARGAEQSQEEFESAISGFKFSIDSDNVIPILKGEWFSDDIFDRFRLFIRSTFGEEHYQDNLQFVEEGLGKDIRSYFLKDFFADHVKKYQKRPIYWLFSSPRGTFNALIYMHRYRPDTVSVVLNDYLREFRTKLLARKGHLEAVSIGSGTSATEKAKAIKEIESLKKDVEELDSYERDVLYPLAAQQIGLQLGDGVKANYARLGKALKSVPGMASEDE